MWSAEPLRSLGARTAPMADATCSLRAPSPRDDCDAVPGIPAAPELSIVIVSYNCRTLLRDCLTSIPQAAGGLSHEIILIDNNSEDGTPALIQKQFPHVRLVRNPANRGFARATNQGLIMSTGQYILLLNPDAIPGGRACQRTHEYMEGHPGLAAATCKVVRPDGRLDPSCKRRFPSVWDAFARMSGLSRLFPKSRVFARYDTYYLDEDTRQEVPLIDACYMMIRRAALEDIGLFDERFFMFAEEMDWCKRAHDRDWSIGYDPAGTTTHIKGEVTRHLPFRMLYQFHRSMALYYLKYHRWWNPMNILVLLGIVCRWLTLMSVNVLRKERRVSG